MVLKHPVVRVVMNLFDGTPRLKGQTVKTEHRTIFSDSKEMSALSEESVDLVVTSPPYPMIEMWDDIFSAQDSGIKKQIQKGNGADACEAMHRLLDQTWKEVCRVLKPGGFACINIGDATRTMEGDFALYPNHARILSYLHTLGFSSLPCILWRKQTNAPNKFMGSGMLPAGAYVTLEHEYILIVRKGSKRVFKTGDEKAVRRQSALFWEERNTWFSDIWFDIKGTVQTVKDKNTRKRSGAFPFNLAYRLINMYSVKGDMVLDPFLGTGTTAMAAMVSGRNSVGYEIDPGLKDVNTALKADMASISRQTIHQRLFNHVDFVRQRVETKGNLKHINLNYGFPVITAQEKELLINDPLEILNTGENRFEVNYATIPQKEFCKDWAEIFNHDNGSQVMEKLKKKPGKQRTLF